MNFHKGGAGKPRGFGFGGFAVAAKKESSAPKVSHGRGLALPKSSAGSFGNSSSSKNPSLPLPGVRKP